MAGRQVPHRALSLESEDVFISVREAARLLGISQQRVYGYLTRGKLTRRMIDERVMLKEAEVLAFASELQQCSSTGVRAWEFPGSASCSLTTILVSVRPDGETLLDSKLAEIHAQNKHQIAGTCSQVISRSPGRLLILLFWPDEACPPAEQREQEIAALVTDLSEACDWSTALITDGRTFATAT